MTAKLRHAANVEHHKWEYNENTGKVYNKNGNIDSKGFSDNHFLSEMMMRNDFLEYMHKNF